jgi:hypothetical protein
MKSIALGLSLVALSAGTVLAAPWDYRGGNYRGGHVNGYERAAIANSAARLAQLKRRAYADGRLSMFERFQIRNAEARHAALVARARRG